MAHRKSDVENDADPARWTISRPSHNKQQSAEEERNSADLRLRSPITPKTGMSKVLWCIQYSSTPHRHRTEIIKRTFHGNQTVRPTATSEWQKHDRINRHSRWRWHSLAKLFSNQRVPPFPQTGLSHEHEGLSNSRTKHRFRGQVWRSEAGHSRLRIAIESLKQNE